KLMHQIDAYKKLAEGKAVIDYGFHGVAQHLNSDVLNDLPLLAEAGVTSLKIYTTYDYKLGQQSILPLLKAARRSGILVTVHAEDDDILTQSRDLFPVTPSSLPLARPEKSESEAIKWLLRLCRAVDDAPLYVVHVSSARGLAEITEARKNGQKNIYA
ncbi:MAG: dihydropyrimidinase, partial [Defluviitaleaceae bacterium]|nr:dihydropyrimidinase [Defluviitaleaceae bacterium]